MIADVDRIDIVSISSQALYTNTEDTEKSELEADLNSECKWILWSFSCVIDWNYRRMFIRKKTQNESCHSSELNEA